MVAEQKSQVSLSTKNIEELFNLPLSIPDYQRIYCWDDKRITNLWNNLVEMPNSEYHMGAIILHHSGDKYDIIDGQQRLVTLTLILQVIGNESSPLLKEKFGLKEARENVANSKYVINRLKEKCEINPTTLKDKIEKYLQFSVLELSETANLDLAYTFFSNQNSRGVPLSDYDILKAHHLRYLAVPEQAEHLAQKWDALSQEKHIEEVMGVHLFRLRKWMRKNSCDEVGDRLIKEEFSSSPIMSAIPPFGERFYFYEKIQGGSHFFAYADIFTEYYRKFIELPQIKLLRYHLNGESHWKYESAIETLLFGYYTKFGTQYLSEALFCLAGVMAKHRFENKRAMQYKINEFAQNSELIMMIDQATSPTFFIAEAIAYTGWNVKKENRTPIQKRFDTNAKQVFDNLMTCKDMNNEERRVSTITDFRIKQMVEQFKK